ncbi:uncharacterized protein EI97DRAFT_472792 [Westerdykella ornata]|uniref:Fungal calcium binding protein domain-containing protein n=1 Tax=Westerdykella ornata TaxID=318751 RepID=A0A6A6K031_WESOR|nr:uncharacterized protein EI97DRAFT_472792 [Westerdykella ornata]KAF2281396.1 hypothetical protein EI97DRAFT_472792 [Westerdykella ornata]
MRFSVPVVAVLTTTAFGAPSLIAPIDTITTGIEQALTLALQAASCSVLSCVSVVTSAGCIGTGITAGSVPLVLQCVGGETSKLCGCAGCVPALGDFLGGNGVC